MTEAYRTPDERFAALADWPFAPRYTEQDGLRLHYVDEGEGDPILLLHGHPTWGYLWRRVIPRLAEVGRVVAPDHFGFGRSDKPVARDWYSFERYCAATARFVDELALERLTVVTHDWGGPVGMRLAVDRPERVDRLVIMNTWLEPGRPPSETWLRYREAVRRSGDALEAGRLVGAGCVRGLGAAAEAAYDAPFPEPAAKAGLVTFPELLPTEPDGHPSLPALQRLREAMARWEKPTLVLFGDSDAVIPSWVPGAFAELVPGAGPARLVERAGHFVQEDAGDEVAEQVARFVSA